jgi:hypothetical protein
MYSRLQMQLMGAPEPALHIDPAADALLEGISDALL